MLPFGVTDVEFSLVTFLSGFVGIALVVGASKFVRVRYLAAFAVGVYLWYFTDTVGDSNYLDVNGGFVYSPYLVALLLLFAIGLLAFFALDRGMFAREPAAYGGLLVGAMAALAVGLHGFGEGADFGFTAAQTSSITLLTAFGGLGPSASWVLHKMLEPAVAAVSYVALTGPDLKRSRKVSDIAVLATVFVLPAVVGSVAGYYSAFDITYVFALGLGASVYAFSRAAGSLYSPGEATSPWLTTRMALSVVLGFLLIFIAALLHS